MTTTSYADPESLGVLATMVNKSLVETGRFFRAAGSTQARTQLKRTIPAAHEEFQNALDNLSEQIFIAKAFLERDYEAVLAQKSALQPAQDTVMDETDVKQDPEPAPSQPEVESASAGAEKDAPGQTEQPAVAKAEEPAPVKQENQPMNQEPENNDEPATAAPDQSPDKPEEISFHSMLNDNSGPNEFDLNLDFGDDDLGNENFLSGSNFANAVDGTNGHTNENDSSGNTAMELQGTGANGPAGGDAFDLELQKTETPGGENSNQQPDAQIGNNTEDIMGPGESSFDDLFMENENFGGEAGGDPNLLDGDGLMNITEIDDNWFS
ncbi:hypothetical protein BDW42DRAFT_45062 [Aspergillus taichungensis]|uniref:Uncharacterized protein n=1 Tax=Aspergillus taichungensis TaxID=482145 RepID=A0A2J5I3L2_9EURO|nr:hypothetical protein BDW42DRAFT_45062 [Aspergillus taichungensis]